MSSINILRPTAGLFANREISEKPIFAGQLLMDGAVIALDHAREVAEVLNAEYVGRQISRMQTSIRSDPELAIGTAKEFLETICKTILDNAQIDHVNRDVPWILKQSLDQIDLGFDDGTPAQKTVRRLLGNLCGVGQSVAEVRNKLGTGHGKGATCGDIDPKLASLVVGTSTSLGLFLINTYFSEDA